MTYYADVKTLAFLGGCNELYTHLQTTPIQEGFCNSLTNPMTPLIWFHITNDWELAKKLKRQSASLGFSCKIQKQYTLPAKKKGKVIFKKYKGLNWDKYGSLDWNTAMIEIAQYPRTRR
jgi:hypothetical protein